MEEFNFGIIGTGRIGAKFCSTFAKGLVPGGKILAVSSREKSRGEKFAAEQGIERAYGSHAELLADTDIHIVYIAVTNEQHFSCCEAALKAGKHVLCEKPLAMNVSEARSLGATAAAKGVFLMEAMWTRFLPALSKAEEWIGEGRIGKLCGIRADICSRRSPVDQPRLFDPARGGGALLDLGVYGLHFVKHFAGQRRLLGIKPVLINNGDIDLSDFIILEYEDGLMAEVNCSIAFNAVNDAYLYGDEGYIRIAPWFSCAQKIQLFKSPFTLPGEYRGQAPVDEFISDTPSGFEFEILHTMDCVRRGKTESPIVSLKDSVEISEIMDRVRGPA
jgi:predicted dehydrogenase